MLTWMYYAPLLDLNLWSIWLSLQTMLTALLAPMEAVWLTSAWPIRLHLWVGTPLVLRLMEGGWWTFFKWLDMLWLSPALLALWLSSLKPSHQSLHRDVRLWFPWIIQADLYYGGLPCYPTSLRYKRLKDRSRGTHLTLQVQWKAIDLYKQRTKSSVHERPATFRASPHPRGVRCLSRDYDAIYDCRDCIMTTQDKIDLQARRNGLTRELLDELLSLIPPLEIFRNEMEIQSKLLGLQSEAHDLEQAFVATADLERKLGMSAPRMSNLSGAYISEHPRSDMPIVFDTGASFSVTPVRTDFVSELTQAEVESMTGLADSVMIEGVGQIEWPLRDVFGRIHMIRTQAFYVPQATIRLFSPQVYFQEHNKGRGTFDGDSLTFTTAEGVDLQFPYHPCNNLPMMYLDTKIVQAGFTTKDMAFLFEKNNSEALTKLCHDNNHNLSKPQKELLLWHHRLGHAGLRWIQDLMRVQKPDVVGDTAEPALITTKISGTANCPHPKCAACQFAKQHRRTPESQRVHNVPEHEMAIRRENLTPGDRVSVDQYVCKVPGRLKHGYGKGRNAVKYSGGTIFVDHASGYISVHHQISLSAGETVQKKHEFERYAKENGVLIRQYHTDNHPFTSESFLADLEIQNQSISYSGVGAHHQNGVAERALQTTTKWALAMMMHQLVHWPTQFDPALWPFALEHAVHIWNNMPRERAGLTPNELFAGIKIPQNDAILRSRVWGCPVYVLDPKLQDGKKLPKWKKRSRVGVYLGVSPGHSTTVGRVLNIDTGYISPQYHVVFDELFHTVPGELTPAAFDSNLWNTLLSLDGLDKAADRTDAKGHEIPFDDHFEEFNQLDPDPDPGPFIPVPEGDGDDGNSDNNSSNNGTSTTEGADDADQYITLRSGKRVLRKDAHLYAANFASHVPKQSSQRHATFRNLQYMAGGNLNSKVSTKQLYQQHLAGLDWNQTISELRTGEGRRVLLSLAKDYDYDSNTLESWNPLALAAKSSDADADTFTFQEAMNHPNSDGFWVAAEKEIETLEKMDVWEEVNRESWMNVLPSTWAFRIKRFPDGMVRKFKARFCARGDRQIHGVDFFDTYAPVVSWNTVRLLLMLSIQHELETKQVDYTAAFVHADVERPPNYDKMSPAEQAKTGVYIEMPRGFSKPGKVYKLKKSLYGLRNSPRQFWLLLKTSLESAGLKQQTEIDPCLFMSDKVICLVYVDDTLLYAKNEKDIDEVLEHLRTKEKLTLEEESTVAGFLGVDIKRNTDDGTITMTQTGLIDRILEALHVEELDPVATPCEEVLGKDEDGDPPDCSFNYASVIGMIWYLYAHSRPDIGMAVSQAARFSFSPKRSHELALVRLGQYLKGTRDKGLIFKPVPVDQFKMDVYVDSDFMGLYGKELRSDPSNVKSRTGFVICLNGCPIIWSSKLQESIALSTMMAEYYALSSAMREVLPLRNLVQTVALGCGIDESVLTTFKTTIWEDNNGALTLANLDPGQQTPRSKFYDVKVHWFRSHLKPNHIEVKKIDTKLQLADLFTKPLTRDLFESLRKMLSGW